MLTRLAIAGYRSLRDVRLGLGRLNVVTGANGSGKSSLYRALRLLADVAQGRAIASLAAEGGNLLGPLARLIAAASRWSQIIVVSHAPTLVAALGEQGARRIALEKQLGETAVPDVEAPSWTWPVR